MKNKQITLREMRSIQLAMLKSIHQFCTVNNIRYSLSGGSLIGAVRHQGFIPWDDDIDLMMPRPDYDRFVQSFSHFHYKVKTYKNDTSYHFPFAKVYDDRTVLIEDYCSCGVFIDVFPIDGLPDDLSVAKGMIQQCAKYASHDLYFASKIYTYQKGNKLFLYAKYLLKRSSVPCRSVTIDRIEKLCRTYDFENSEFAGVLVWGYGEKEHMKSCVFKEYSEYMFEGLRLKGISDYDTYLTHLYGDYMTLPPEENRIPCHSANVYWK